MSSVFDHLHLKRNTKGSSNELSFDVLDAARTNADAGRESRTPRVLDNANGSRGNYRGIAGTATLSGQAQAEIERRKHARRARVVRLRVLGIVVAVGVLAVAGYFGYNYYMDVQEFSQRFDVLVHRFIVADECLASVDALMASPQTANVATRQNTQERMPETVAALDELKELVEQDRAYALNERDSAALDQVVAAADARIAMIGVAGRTMQVVDAANSASSEVNAIWADVLAADQEARAATGAANQASTEKATKAARDATAKARKPMVSALEKLKGIDERRADLGLAQQISYLEKRCEALKHAVATSDALIEGKREVAASENEAYNAADAEAAAIAESLPISIEEVVEDSYEDDLAGLHEEYETARNQAIEADALIREYKGI